jgi:hypothetical protein
LSLSGVIVSADAHAPAHAFANVNDDPAKLHPQTGRCSMTSNTGQLPIFYIPVGRERQDGEVVLFASEPESSPAVEAWCDRVLEHPATLAAGGCLMIGPSMTMHFDLQSHTVIQTRTAEGHWQPTAVTDLG